MKQPSSNNVKIIVTDSMEDPSLRAKLQHKYDQENKSIGIDRMKIRRRGDMKQGS